MKDAEKNRHIRERGGETRDRHTELERQTEREKQKEGGREREGVRDKH